MAIDRGDTRNIYVASGGQQTFAFTFRIFADTDIRAYRIPRGEDPNPSTHAARSIIVTIAETGVGGTVQFRPDPFGRPTVQEGDTIVLVSSIPYDREADYQTNGRFSAETLNNDLDRIVSLVKQLRDEQMRALTVSGIARGGDDGIFVEPPRAGWLVRWNNAASGLENVDPTDVLFQGPRGPAGPPGRDGRDGEHGEHGDTGPRGNVGQRGPIGPQGRQGDDGVPGIRGRTGSEGPQGPRGFTGARGQQGIQGVPGMDGRMGIDGAPGPIGPKGDKGDRGDKGDPGDPGDEGPAGPPGDAPPGQPLPVTTVFPDWEGPTGNGVVLTNTAEVVYTVTYDYPVRLVGLNIWMSTSNGSIGLSSEYGFGVRRANSPAGDANLVLYNDLNMARNRAGTLRTAGVNIPTYFDINAPNQLEVAAGSAIEIVFISRTGSSTLRGVSIRGSITFTRTDNVLTGAGGRGARGERGPIGLTGPRGADGMTGPAGARGERGATGAAGAMGIQGPQGDDGATGPQGAKGDTGARGERGDDGPRGERGPTGPQGNDGNPGPQGEKGDKGDRGDDGPPGQKGEDGAPGERGPQGPAGMDGSGGDGGVRTVNSLIEMMDIVNPQRGDRVFLETYFIVRDSEGKAVRQPVSPANGLYSWQPDQMRNEANGGTIISPIARSSPAWDGSERGIFRFLRDQGIAPGTGCWVREPTGDSRINLEVFGGRGRVGATDVPAFNAAIAYLSRVGGGVLVLQRNKIYEVTDEIIIDWDNVVIEGGGAGFQHDTQNAGIPTNEGTRIQFRRSSNGTDKAVVRLTSVSEADTVRPTRPSLPRRSRSGLRNLTIDANNSAWFGVVVQSVSNFILENLFIHDPRHTGLDFTCLVRAYNPEGSSLWRGNLGEASDNQYGRVSNVAISCGYARLPADGGQFGAHQARGMWLGGSINANTSLNQMDTISVFHQGGAGVVLDNCDNNHINGLRIFRAVEATNANTALLFLGGRVALEAARANKLTGVSAREIFSEGLGNRAGILVPAFNNIIEYDYQNYKTIPLIGRGSTLEHRNEESFPERNIIKLSNGWAMVVGRVVLPGTTSPGAFSTVNVDLPQGLVVGPNPHRNVWPYASASNPLTESTTATGTFSAATQPPGIWPILTPETTDQVRLVIRHYTVTTATTVIWQALVRTLVAGNTGIASGEAGPDEEGTTDPPILPWPMLPEPEPDPEPEPAPDDEEEEEDRSEGS